MLDTVSKSSAFSNECIFVTTHVKKGKPRAANSKSFLYFVCYEFHELGTETPGILKLNDECMGIGQV